MYNNAGKARKKKGRQNSLKTTLLRRLVTQTVPTSAAAVPALSATPLLAADKLPARHRQQAVAKNLKRTSLHYKQQKQQLNDEATHSAVVLSDSTLLSNKCGSVKECTQTINNYIS